MFLYQFSVYTFVSQTKQGKEYVNKSTSQIFSHFIFVISSSQYFLITCSKIDKCSSEILFKLLIGFLLSELNENWERNSIVSFLSIFSGFIHKWVTQYETIAEINQSEIQTISVSIHKFFNAWCWEPIQEKASNNFIFLQLLILNKF